MPYTEEQREYHRVYYVKRRQRLLDYVGTCCVDCGSVEGLEFDHEDPTQKSFDIKSNLTLNDVVKAELDKCVLRCSPCHEKKSIEERDPFSHGTMYGWMRKKCPCTICYEAKRAWHDERNAKRRKPGGRGPYRKRA